MRMPVMNGRQAVKAIRVVEGQLDAGSVPVIAMAGFRVCSKKIPLSAQDTPVLK